MLKTSPWFMIYSVLFVGCTVGPKYMPPEVDVPCEWHSEVSDGMHTEPVDSYAWWESLNDPTLTSLIERAACQNLDLHIAATRVLLARAEHKGKKGDLLPHVDATVNYDHVYYSKDALVNGLLGTACPIKKHVRRNVDFFELGFDAEWEIDLFGMTAHELSALKAMAEASEESLCGIWITLTAEISRNYVELRGLQQRLDILQRNIETQQKGVGLLNQLFERGIASEFTLKQAEGDLITLSVQRPLLELGISKAIHRLSILLGYNPGELYCELTDCRTLPLLPDCKPIGVPSDLLRRRPDIRKAERELAAATERTGSAVAALFPRFSLRGFVGDISTHAGSIFKPASATWVAGPQLLVPIFNSKLLLQDVEYNKIQTRQALYEYQKTVLEALEESENALASYHAELQRSQHLDEGYRNSQRALELIQDLLQRGLKDYQEVLTVTKSRFAAEDALMQSQVDLLMHYISLYKALGGGWCQCSE